MIVLFLDMYPPLGICVVLLNDVSPLLDLHKTTATQKSVKGGSLEYGVSLGKCCPTVIGKHLPMCWYVAMATIEGVDEEEESIDWASRF